jgi:hypothetical protein
MLEDHFELQYVYMRSKLVRLQRFARNLIGNKKSVLSHKEEIAELLKDKLEEPFALSEGNLYIRIMDEGLNGTEAYNNLIK